MGADGGLEAALERLVERRVVDRGQADAVLAEMRAPARPAAARGSWVPLLAEIGGYVGGTFIFAAAAVVTGPRWGTWSTGQRVALLAVPAAILLVAAVAVALTGPRRGARDRLVGALVLLAGGLLAGVTWVLADGRAVPTLAFATALAVWTLGYLGRRTALLHAGMAVAAAMAVAATAEWGFTGSGPTLSAWLLLALAPAWLALTLLRVLREQVLGRVVAAVIAFAAAEWVVLGVEGGAQRVAGYAALAVLAGACFAAYLSERHSPVLAAGVVTLAVAVPQCVIDYTDGALGAGGALLVTGLSIVGASVLGLRVRREALHAA